MRWNVEVVDRASGQTSWVTIDARDAIGAREEAGRLGVVGKVLPAQSVAPPVGAGSAAAALDYRELKRAIRWGVVEAYLTLVLLLLAVGTVVTVLGIIFGFLGLLPETGI